MGDMAEVFRAMNADKKKRHQTWHQKNTAELKKQNIPFRAASDECYTIRTEKVKADFYPSTGRWRDINTGKMHRDGAVNFCLWFYRRVTE